MKNSYDWQDRPPRPFARQRDGALPQEILSGWCFLYRPETRVFCVELKMGPSGHMDSTGIFPDSNTREFGTRRKTYRQPPRPTHKCNAPRLPFHVHLTHDLTRVTSSLPLHTAALAFVSFGIVLVQVQGKANGSLDIKKSRISLVPHFRQPPFLVLPFPAILTH